MLTHLRRAASIGAVVLSSLGPTGCAFKPVSIPVVPYRPLRSATLEEVLAAHESYCKSIETLNASGDLEVRDLRAGKQRRLGVRLLAARGGRLYLKGSVAVVTALEITADGERFWFVVPPKKTVWTGRAGSNPRAEDDKAPYYALRPSDVVSGLIPEPLTPTGRDTLVFEADRESFSLTLARLESGRGVARRRVWLERQTLRLLRSRRYDEGGDLLSEVTLADWQGGSPRRVLVARPRDGYEATFFLDEVKVNAPVPPHVFAPRIPGGYKLVEVDEP